MSLRTLNATGVHHLEEYMAWKLHLQGWWEDLKPKIQSRGYQPHLVRHECVTYWLANFQLYPFAYWLLTDKLGPELGKDMQAYLILYAQLRKLMCGGLSPDQILAVCGESYWVGQRDLLFK